MMQTDLPPRPGAPGAAVDTAVFERLLAAVGPAAQPELLRRLRDDFQSHGADLPLHPAKADLTQVRKLSHVAVALAGVVGAARLQMAATALHDAAEHGDLDKARQLCPAVQEQSTEIIAFLKQQLRARTGAA